MNALHFFSDIRASSPLPLLAPAFLRWLGESLARMTVLLPLGGGLCVPLRRASARLRQQIWFWSLLGAAILPLATYLLPPLPLRILPASRGLNALATAGSVTSSANLKPADTLAFQGITAVAGTQSSDITAGGLSESTVPVVQPSSVSPRSEITTFVLWLVAIWVLGALAVFGRMCRGLIRLRRLQQNCVDATDPGPRALLRQMAVEAGVDRPFRLVYLPGGCHSPSTWGWRHPVILVPEGILSAPGAALRPVLLHELEHVARGDWLSQLLARAVCGFYWFHPLFWWALTRMQREAERACDDQVLLRGVLPSFYAAQLLEIVRAMKSGTTTSSPLATSMAHHAQLASRLEAILNTRLPRHACSKGARAACALVLALAIAPVAATRLAARDSFVPVSVSESSGLTHGSSLPLETPGMDAPAPFTDSSAPVPMLAPQESLPATVPQGSNAVTSPVQTEPKSVIAWGDTVGGLQLGIAFANGKALKDGTYEFREGDPIRLRVLYRNAGAAGGVLRLGGPCTLTGGVDRSGCLQLHVRRAGEGLVIPDQTLAAHQEWALPGELPEIHTTGRFDGEEKDPRTIALLSPREFAVRISAGLPRGGAWSGAAISLTSAKLAFRIVPNGKLLIGNPKVGNAGVAAKPGVANRLQRSQYASDLFLAQQAFDEVQGRDRSNRSSVQAKPAGTAIPGDGTDQVPEKVRNSEAVRGQRISEQHVAAGQLVAEDAGNKSVPADGTSPAATTAASDRHALQVTKAKAEFDEARALMAAAKARLQLAQANLNRINAQFQSGVANAEARDTAQANTAVAEADVAVSEARMNKTAAELMVAEQEASKAPPTAIENGSRTVPALVQRLQQRLAHAVEEEKALEAELADLTRLYEQKKVTREEPDGIRRALKGVVSERRELERLLSGLQHKAAPGKALQ